MVKLFPSEVSKGEGGGTGVALEVLVAIEELAAAVLDEGDAVRVVSPPDEDDAAGACLEPDVDNVTVERVDPLPLLWNGEPCLR